MTRSPVSELPSGLRMRTFISPVIRPKRDENGQLIAGDPIHDRYGKPVYWMDELFGGGIVIPSGVLTCREDPLLWLVTGPPGAGKTTFALELCRNLADHQQDERWTSEQLARFTIQEETPIPGISESDRQRLKAQGIQVTREVQSDVEKRVVGNRIRTLYISLETPASRIIENMNRFGWSTQRVKPLQAGAKLEDDVSMWVLGREFLREKGASMETRGSGDAEPTTQFLTKIGDAIDGVWGGKLLPGLVVIDSLNTLYVDEAQLDDIISQIRSGLNTRTWIVMLLRDGEPEGRGPWEYLSDITTRLDRISNPKGYQLGSFEIIKARNQEHALGDNHRLKIYSRPDFEDTGLARGRVTPYLKSGGLYVFPSVHRLLSASWTQSDEREAAEGGPPLRFPLPLPAMAPLLGTRKGAPDVMPSLPVGRCSVFVGRRGLLKSYLAYFWMLKQLEADALAADALAMDALTPKALAAKSPVRALLLSLRDDEDGAKQTLQRICEDEKLKGPDGSVMQVQDLIDADRLSIVHFRPGYMPPEEFMHNVLVHLKGVRVAVVNGIDHLRARLPLCAALDVFVPALVHLLSRHGVTTVCSATEEHKGDTVPLGLLPTADFVLRFEEGETLAELGDGEQQTFVTAERVPAGGIGGRSGYLYRHPEQGLTYVPPPTKDARKEPDRG